MATGTARGLGRGSGGTCREQVVNGVIERGSNRIRDWDSGPRIRDEPWEWGGCWGVPEGTEGG